MKTYYTDYVGHMLRFYARYTVPGNENWEAVQRVFVTLETKEAEMLKSVYTHPGVLDAAVREVAQKHGLNPDKLWNLISKVIRKIAKERGLI